MAIVPLNEAKQWCRKMLGDRGAGQGWEAVPTRSAENFLTYFSARWRSSSYSISLYKRSCTS